MKIKTVALSAGGTGGHVFPAIALARVLQGRGVRVLFFTDTRGLKFAQSLPDLDVRVIPSGTIRRAPVALIKDLLALLRGCVRATRIVVAERVDAVVGFGGYPSFPGVVAGLLTRRRVVLHEQNAVLGKANAAVARFVDTLALSLPPSNLHPLPHGLVTKTVITGNPVRADIAGVRDVAYAPAAHDGVFNLVVFGGSLGASVFARVVPDAIARLPKEAQKRLHVTQQCRAQDMESAKESYVHADVGALNLAPFFTDVAGLVRDAHLVIARSGASTVAELAVAGRPAIFVPYPHHGDAQQSRNAESLVDAGGALMMEESGFTADALANRLEPFLQSPEQLSPVAAAAAAQGRPLAAESLADLVVKDI